MRSNWYVLMAILATLFVGCSKTVEKSGYKVLIPWPTKSGESYALQVVDLPTLKDPNSVSGSSAKVYLDPKFTEEGLKGTVPTAKYVETNEGVLIPSDFMSAQFFGVYAHTEKLWDLDESLGIGRLVTHPRKLGLKARVIDNRKGQIKNNASFFAKVDGTLIMPFEANSEFPEKQLPLALNGGIIAHEHFHALFSAIMGELIRVEDEVSLFDSCSLHDHEEQNEKEDIREDNRPKKRPKKKINEVEQHNLLVMRAINEGLADIWGWIYTGDDDFISHSLPELGRNRKLDEKLAAPYPSTQDFFERSKAYPEHLKIILSYELGTSIARQIRFAAEQMAGKRNLRIQDSENRLKIAKYIVELLPVLKNNFEHSVKSGSLIETSILNEDLVKLSAGGEK